MMNLYKTVELIKKIISKIPNAGTIFDNDIYQLNQIQNVKYPSYCITQQTHTQNLNDEKMAFHFYIFYVDRLTDDDSNRLEIQSTAINCLKKVVDTLEENGSWIENATYTTFNERFNDRCSGAYVEFSVVYDANDCGLDYQIVL